MRKPIIFKDHCDDELPWACCYEDDESSVEWIEGRFYIGFGKTAVEAYEDWKIKQLKSWNHYPYSSETSKLNIKEFNLNLARVLL